MGEYEVNKSNTETVVLKIQTGLSKIAKNTKLLMVSDNREEGAPGRSKNAGRGFGTSFLGTKDKVNIGFLENDLIRAESVDKSPAYGKNYKQDTLYLAELDLSEHKIKVEHDGREFNWRLSISSDKVAVRILLPIEQRDFIGRSNYVPWGFFVVMPRVDFESIIAMAREYSMDFAHHFVPSFIEAIVPGGKQDLWNSAGVITKNFQGQTAENARPLEIKKIIVQEKIKP